MVFSMFPVSVIYFYFCGIDVNHLVNQCVNNLSGSPIARYIPHFVGLSGRCAFTKVDMPTLHARPTRRLALMIFFGCVEILVLGWL